MQSSSLPSRLAAIVAAAVMAVAVGLAPAGAVELPTPGPATATSAAANASALSAFTKAPKPSIKGTPTVGKTLTAIVGTWSPKPSSYNYRWYRDGKPISGATKKTYVATKSDIGHKITVNVAAKRSGHASTTRSSASVTVWRKLSVGTPTITGTAKVGATLTVKRGSWGPGKVTTKVQWYVAGKSVKGATGSTYKVKAADAYKSITVKVTGSRSGYTSASKTSSAKKPSGIAYANCTALKKHYPHGVKKSSTTVNLVSGKVRAEPDRSPFVSAALYSLNTTLDRDKDGWACE